MKLPTKRTVGAMNVKEDQGVLIRLIVSSLLCMLTGKMLSPTVIHKTNVCLQKQNGNTLQEQAAMINIVLATISPCLKTMPG